MSAQFADISRRIPSYWSEVFPVERGLRSTGIIEVEDSGAGYFEEFLMHKNLSYVKIAVSDLNREREKRGQDQLMNYFADNLFYIGDEMRKVRTLVECDYNNDFFCVGMMLGYPDCCVAAFFHRGTESVDAERLRARFSMIAHIPCTENCLRSEEYDRKLVREKEIYLAELSRDPCNS